MDELLGVELDYVEKDFISEIIDSLIIPCAMKKRVPTEEDILHKIIELARKEYRR